MGFSRQVHPRRSLVAGLVLAAACAGRAGESPPLTAQGVGRHLTPKEVVVFGPRGPIDNALRAADEPARHKVLDLVGDLSLCGFDLAGHVVAYRSGHALNVELAKMLAEFAAGTETPRRVARMAA